MPRACSARWPRGLAEGSLCVNGLVVDGAGAGVGRLCGLPPAVSPGSLGSSLPPHSWAASAPMLGPNWRTALLPPKLRTRRHGNSGLDAAWPSLCPWIQPSHLSPSPQAMSLPCRGSKVRGKRTQRRAPKPQRSSASPEPRGGSTSGTRTLGRRRLGHRLTALLAALWSTCLPRAGLPSPPALSRRLLDCPVLPCGPCPAVSSLPSTPAPPPRPTLFPLLSWIPGREAQRAQPCSHLGTSSRPGHRGALSARPGHLSAAGDVCVPVSVWRRQPGSRVWPTAPRGHAVPLLPPGARTAHEAALAFKRSTGGSGQAHGLWITQLPLEPGQGHQPASGTPSSDRAAQRSPGPTPALRQPMDVLMASTPERAWGWPVVPLGARLGPGWGKVFSLDSRAVPSASRGSRPHRSPGNSPSACGPPLPRRPQLRGADSGSFQASPPTPSPAQGS